MARFSPHFTLYLNYRIIQKFEGDHKKKTGKTYKSEIESELYGFGNYAYPPNTEGEKPVKDSINKFVFDTECKRIGIDTESPKDFKKRRELGKKIDGKYLWTKKGEAEEAIDEDISFDDNYFLLYLNYLNKSEDKIFEEFEASYVYYVGFYLSFTEFQIKSFIVKISTIPNGKSDKHNKHNKNNKKKYSTTLWGIHARKGGIIDDEIYSGETVYEGKWVCMNLKGDNFKRRINVLGAVDEQEEKALAKRKYVRASLQGTAMADDRVITWEVFLYQTTWEIIKRHTADDDNPLGPISFSTMTHGSDSEKLITEREFKIISFYLILHRNVIAFKNDEINNLLRLTSRGVIVSQFITLPGVYRLWNFNFTGDSVTQSIFEIHSDGTAHLYPYIPPFAIPSEDTSEYAYTNVNASDEDEINTREKLLKQSVLLNISKVHESLLKIVLISFAGGLSIASIGVFDFETNSLSSRAIIEGAYTTLGYKGNISGYFVMRRERDIELSPKTDVWEKKVEETIEYAKQHSLISFFMQLCEVYRKKHLRSNELNENRINQLIEDLRILLDSQLKAQLNIQE